MSDMHSQWFNPDQLTIIAGPCVIESDDLIRTVANKLKSLQKQNITVIFKASYDKANRTAKDSFRGPGLAKGLASLKSLKSEFQLPIITDVHDIHQVEKVSEVADIIQIPAFLCRQTDLIREVAQSGSVINIKKGQFLSPWAMKHVVEKAKSFGAKEVWLTERGASFGYGSLVVDPRSFHVMSQFGCPVIFDATHSVQSPASMTSTTQGDRQFIPVLARAAVAAGVQGLFFETHPDPDVALSDGPNMWPLDQLVDMVTGLNHLHSFIHQNKIIKRQLSI
ncbi:3-deoxy-8-phosphooctulonate synthase [Gammaproteobacteria bacterium]|nr:3-deoxy-8-phosphooctulonate synthase [Gammaproteobacteria bacterium]